MTMATNDHSRPCDMAVMVAPTGNHENSRRVERRWLVLVLLTVVLAVLLGGTLVVNASAAPDGAQPAPPTSTSVPMPTNQLPVPTPDAPPPTTGCVPGQIGCAPPTTTTTTSCAGEDCIPQPTTAPPGPGAPGQEDGAPVEDPNCGMLTDPTGCMVAGINAIFRGLADAALAPMLELLAATALSTPTIDQLPGIGALWHNSFEIVVAVYGLLILIGGIVVMSHESVQTRYSVKEIGPRIVVAFLASALSLFFVDKLIRLANAFTAAILGDGVNPPSLGDTLKEATAGALTGGLFLILTVLVLVVVGLGLLIVYVVRVMLTVILVITGPVFLMFHALPHTDGLARWWWKATTVVVTIQIGQSFVLLVAVKTLLSGGMYLFVSFGSLGTLIGAIGLFYVLYKLPFWMFAVVKVGSGRSLIGGLARAYVAAKTFGMISGHSAAGRAPAAAQASAGGTRTKRPSVAPRTARQSSGPDTATRLRRASEAERTRAARHVRRPSPAPAFLQPGVQATTHDPAIDRTASSPATAPTFSAAPDDHTPTLPGPARRASRPRFRAPSNSHSAQQTRAASVPPQLRFQPAQPAPPHARTPLAATSSAPPPVFRAAQPPPRIGDARRRTPSVPPLVFRAPKPRDGKTS
jgi:hypothetical protein